MFASRRFAVYFKRTHGSVRRYQLHSKPNNMNDPYRGVIFKVLHLLSSTSRSGARPGGACLRFMNRLATCIKPNTRNCYTDAEDGKVQRCQNHLLPVRGVVAPVEIQPKDATHSVGEPGSKHCGDEAKQRIEVGNALSNYPSDYPEYQGDASP